MVEGIRIRGKMMMGIVLDFLSNMLATNNPANTMAHIIQIIRIFYKPFFCIYIMFLEWFQLIYIHHSLTSKY